jgi:hypothetical protein
LTDTQILPAGLDTATLESLDDHTLGELYAESGRILADRCSAELPAAVETAVRAAPGRLTGPPQPAGRRDGAVRAQRRGGCRPGCVAW